MYKLPFYTELPNTPVLQSVAKGNFHCYPNKAEVFFLKVSGEDSDLEVGHGTVQRVAAPVVVVPAQEPAGERGRLEALLDLHNRSTAVSVGRVRLDVTGS